MLCNTPRLFLSLEGVTPKNKDKKKEKQMKKLMMVAGVVALAGMMSGCISGKAGEDKVAAWQKDRTPVEVL